MNASHIRMDRAKKCKKAVPNTTILLKAVMTVGQNSLQDGLPPAQEY